jgi:hypothetical protein
MRTALIIAIAVGTLATPAAVMGRDDRATGKGRVETQAQCEARQQKIRDPVSGVRIQAGDAQRFCSRQPGRR